jgi:hypothetical protein
MEERHTGDIFSVYAWRDRHGVALVGIALTKERSLLYTSPVFISWNPFHGYLFEWQLSPDCIRCRPGKITQVFLSPAVI